MEKCNVSVTRTVQGWLLAAMVGNNRVSKHYIGFTKREAVQSFRSELIEV